MAWGAAATRPTAAKSKVVECIAVNESNGVGKRKGRRSVSKGMKCLRNNCVRKRICEDHKYLAAMRYIPLLFNNNNGR